MLRLCRPGGGTRGRPPTSTPERSAETVLERIRVRRHSYSPKGVGTQTLRSQTNKRIALMAALMLLAVGWVAFSYQQSLRPPGAASSTATGSDAGKSGRGFRAARRKRQNRSPVRLQGADRRARVLCVLVRRLQCGGSACMEQDIWQAYKAKGVTVVGLAVAERDASPTMWTRLPN